MEKIYQLFKPVYHKEEIFKEITECFDKGWTGLGFKTIEFENKWNEYTGHKHSHFLNSATSGLHLAVKILKEKYGWKEGDEIISTPITFVSTNEAILYEKLNVIFADILPDGTLDPKNVEKKITNKTRAIMFVGLAGNIGKLDEIITIAEKNNIKVILDAAHMSGSRYNEKHILTKSCLECIVYSFQAVKNLPTADSGMICFEDEKDDILVRQLSWMGIDKDTYTRSNSNGAYKWHYDVPNLGYKYHGNSIMACIGLVELKYLDISNSYRRTLSSWYRNLLEPKGIECVTHVNQNETSQHIFQVKVNNRDKIMLSLNNCGIYPGVHYKTNAAYKIFNQSIEDTPKATRFSDSVLALPIHLNMTKKDVEFISEKLIQSNI